MPTHWVGREWYNFDPRTTLLNYSISMSGLKSPACQRSLSACSSSLPRTYQRTTPQHMVPIGRIILIYFSLLSLFLLCICSWWAISWQIELFLSSNSTANLSKQIVLTSCCFRFSCQIILISFGMTLWSSLYICDTIKFSLINITSSAFL